jgi:hypothetical protein
MRAALGGNRLRGVILTQSDRDVFYAPAASAIFLERIDGRKRLADLERQVGPLGPEDPTFDDATRELASIERSSLFQGSRNC